MAAIQLRRFANVLIVDELNRVVGTAPMAQVVAIKSIFRTANAFVFNPEGKLWVQRRLDTDVVFPGMLDFAPGGVVHSSDSSDEAAIIRELQEEFGVTASVKYVDSIFISNKGWRWWSVLFQTNVPNVIKPNLAEVHSVQLMSLEEIRQGMQHLSFTPNSVQCWQTLEHLQVAK